MRHSQRCTVAPLACWIIAEASGEIISAHCNCMAGLGEACTHVAAVAFFVESSCRQKGITLCTEKKCKWIVPSFQKDIPYLPVKDIDFRSAKRKKMEMECKGLCTPPTEVQPFKMKDQLQAPTDIELNEFFDKLSKCNTKPAILSTVPEYALGYVPKSSLDSFTRPLQSLYQPEYLGLKFTDLLTVCESVEIQVTAEMADMAEKETRKQSNCKLWFKYRAGRITASKMKSVCRTDPASPSQSLVKSICYPEVYRFKSKATDWGCKHEQTARDSYFSEMKKSHDGFQVSESGLVLNSQWPHLGASPDGIISCDCCGIGVLEIKCPYCHRTDTVVDASSEDKKFWR